MFLHVSKNCGQRFQKLLFRFEIAIVSTHQPGVMPQTFGGIVLGRISRKLMNLQPMPVLFEPFPDTRVLVIRSVVLDQINAVCPGATGSRCHLFQEAQIRPGVKYRVTTINESGFLEIDSSKDLHAFSGSRDRNEGLIADSRPRLVKRRVLAEAGFVLEEDIGSFIPRFFLMLG